MPKYRVRFTKTANLRFVGHLDLMRFFQKAVRRAGIEVAYSKGYSPHQLMSFASPLGLGATTDGDYMDIELVDALAPTELMSRLNAELTEEVFITEAETLPDSYKSSMAKLLSCDYMLVPKEEGDFPADFRGSFEDFVAQDEIVITKKTKKTEKVMDIKPMIYAHAFDSSEFERQTKTKIPTLHSVYTSEEAIFLRLASESGNSIKPSLVLDTYFEKIGFSSREYGIHTHRLDMQFAE